MSILVDSNSDVLGPWSLLSLTLCIAWQRMHPNAAVDSAPITAFAAFWNVVLWSRDGRGTNLGVFETGQGWT